MDVHGALVDVADRGDRHLAALAGHQHRGLHHLLGDHAGRHDRVVGELAPGGLDDELVRLLGGGERVRGAEHGGGHLPLELHRVHHDHVLRPGEPGALHRVAAHAARAEDHHGVAGLDPGRVHRGPPAGRNAAAHQAEDLPRDVLEVLAQRHGGPLRHDRVLGEGAERAEPAQVLLAQVEPERAVEEHAGAGVEALDAHVRVPGRARPAGAAGRDVRADDLVARLDALHAGADRLDDAGALVPAHDRHPDGGVARGDVVVGVAEPGGHQLDPDLVRLGLVELQVGDLPAEVRAPGDGSASGDVLIFCGSLATASARG